MVARVSRPYLGWLAVVWVFSVISLGLVGRLIAKGTIWYGEARPVTIENTFAMSWGTFFTTILLIGSAVAPEFFLFGAALNFVLLFLGFLLSVVGLGSITGIINQFGYSGEMTSLWKAYLGIGWCQTFFIFFAALWAGYHYVTGQATPVKEHKEEHF
ncbi:hypothetical protein JCM10207_006442 [Rhodosporidiobolus poonsookiae]